MEAKLKKIKSLGISKLNRKQIHSCHGYKVREGMTTKGLRTLFSLLELFCIVIVVVVM